jgi:hypothetical protein
MIQNIHGIRIVSALRRMLLLLILMQVRRVVGEKVGAFGALEKSNETTSGRGRCNWVRQGLTGLLPRLPRPLRIRFAYRQSGIAGAINMRARQMSRILATHPDVNVELLRVRDCRVYCAHSREDGVTHVIYVKYPCPSCARHRGAFQVGTSPSP